MNSASHYVPAFCEQNGPNQERAVCGVWVRPSEHSAEPTCPTCQRWLADDASVTADSFSVDKDDPLMRPVKPSFATNSDQAYNSYTERRR